MANPLFSRQNPPAPVGGGIFGAMFNRMYQNNPQFRDFANSMKGLSEDEMISKCGVDPNQVRNAVSNPSDFFMKNGMM